MKSGYKIHWTDHAISELKDTIEHLEENWTERELTIFSQELDHTIELISKNPDLFQASKKTKDIRRAVVLKYNKLYYRTKDNTVEILSFFSTRSDPKKLKL